MFVYVYSSELWGGEGIRGAGWVYISCLELSCNYLHRHGDRALTGQQETAGACYGGYALLWVLCVHYTHHNTRFDVGRMSQQNRDCARARPRRYQICMAVGEHKSQRRRKS